MKPLFLRNSKEKFAREELRDRQFRARAGQILEKILGSRAVLLKNFSQTPKKIIFTAENKSFAQEIFFHREALEAEFKKEIVIR